MTNLKKCNVISAATVARLVKIKEYNNRRREEREQLQNEEYFEAKNPCKDCRLEKYCRQPVDVSEKRNCVFFHSYDEDPEGNQ